ncbi:MAG TPA: SH3 domain-containing protein, partial [Pyrinomonadaceae bacterium]
MKILGTVIFTLLFAFSLYAQKQAEVIVTSTHLRQSPDINSEKVQTIQKGEKVVFEKSRDTNGWYYVSTSNGTVKGWIRKDTIGSITNVEKNKQTPEKPAETAKAANKTPQVNNKTSQTINKPPQVNNQPKQTTVPVPTPNPSSPVNENSVSANSPATSPAQAEEPPPVEDTEVLKIDTAEVSLNVRVVDGNNRPVGNLNQSHFKV